MPRRFLALVLALSLYPACATRNPGDPLKPGYNVYSKEQDIQLGQQAAREISSQVNVVRDEALQSYVRQIGQKLASVPAAGDYPYSFTLINDPSINAFALPGGPVFINTGLLEATDNEAQFAGVLAHEISHVALRHATSQASKANILQLPAALASIFMGQGSTAAQLGQLGLGLGLNALVLRYSRSAETEADALGARILAAAGYNPIEMARFFEKLEQQGGSRAPEFLSSHPNPGNRVRAVEAEIRTFPQGNYQASSGRFEQVKQAVARLPESGQQTRARLAPQQQPQAPSMGTSSDFQTFNGGRFSISYPSVWQSYAANDQSSVALAPRQGIVPASSGGLQVGYGALISYYQPQRSTNLRQATAELLSMVQQSNPSMRVAGNARRVNVGGQPALITPLRSVSPYGGAESDYLLTVARPEGLFYMVFVAPERDFNSLQGTFDQMVRSIQFR
ncbi:MAG TPA: M48 family metallopeptidase [Bryobacteraceae bacterium]|nr:M48 family metallopeptidase [Bryobacteraceae bacterium]